MMLTAILTYPQSERARAARRQGQTAFWRVELLCGQTSGFRNKLYVSDNSRSCMGDYTCFMCQWQDNERDNFVLVLRGTDIDYQNKIYICVACYDEFQELGQ